MFLNTVYHYVILTKDGNKEITGHQGTFTAVPSPKAGNKDFEFLYITDTQINTLDMFDVFNLKSSKKATYNAHPGAKFLLYEGNSIETSRHASEIIENSELEEWF